MEGFMMRCVAMGCDGVDGCDALDLQVSRP